MADYRYFVELADVIADKDSLFVALLNEVFPHSGMNEELYRWKHVDNPYGPSIIGWCENTAGDIVGFRALWSQGLVHGGESFLAFQPCDTATKKESRGSGVFSHLVDLCMQYAAKIGGAAVFNFPNQNSLPLYLKRNWAVQRGVRRFVRVVNISGVLRNYREVRDKFIPEIKNSAHDIIDFSGVEYFPDPNYISTRINEEILDWRFNRHPRFGYRLIGLPSIGFAVYRAGRRGLINEAELVFVSSRGSGVLRRLSKALASSYVVDCISIVANSKTPVLAGFLPAPSSINFVWRSISAELGEVPFDLQPMQIDVV